MILFLNQDFTVSGMSLVFIVSLNNLVTGSLGAIVRML